MQKLCNCPPAPTPKSESMFKQRSSIFFIRGCTVRIDTVSDLPGLGYREDEALVWSRHISLRDLGSTISEMVISVRKCSEGDILTRSNEVFSCSTTTNPRRTGLYESVGPTKALEELLSFQSWYGLTQPRVDSTAKAWCPLFKHAAMHHKA